MIPSSRPSSNGFVPCRIEWRPSRWLAGGLVLLAALAPAALWASELPAGAAGLLGLAALVHGLRLADREWRRPGRSLLFTADGRLLVDDIEAADMQLQWRGPLAFMSFHDPAGLRLRLAWWPDTLPSARRRELRLAADRLVAARAAPSVAP